MSKNTLFDLFDRNNFEPMEHWFKRLIYLTAVTLLLSGNSFAKEKIPYVGCPGSSGSDGPGVEPSVPGDPVEVDIDPGSASLLAFYAGPYGPWLIAPRGWHCFWEESTDGNYSILVTPSEKDLLSFENYNSSGSSSAAISYDFWDGGTGGHLVVFPLLERYFSRLSPLEAKAALSEAIKSGYISKYDIIPSYTSDQISYKPDDMMEFITPPNQDGLGTWASPLAKSNLPIHGIVQVDMTGDTDAQIFRVRLPKQLDFLRQPILENFESDMKKAGSQ